MDLASPILRFHNQGVHHMKNFQQTEMAYTKSCSYLIPTMPIPSHSFLTLSHHSLSVHSHQLWLISSPHPPTHTYFLRVLRVYRLYALICLTYLITLRVYVLNVCIRIRTVRFTNDSVLISAFNVSKCFTFLLAPCAYVLT